MQTYLGLTVIDLLAIAVYFLVVMLIGFWASRKVKSQEDFLLGGRKFSKGLLLMHWLCTGTHSEMAVQVSGATARVGLGGIWYQWLYLFSTPFYWLIAPVMRRLRVVTTGDFFRIRYGRRLEILYAGVALAYLILSVALLLRGAAAAIDGATGGALPTNMAVIVLSLLFSTYVVAGGLVAAAYTDVLQGIMIVALSVMLIPAGLNAVGGMRALQETLPPDMLAITAPPNAPEGSLLFVITVSLLGLAGVVVQPHVMTATGSGKTETDARVGMCYGNFIKRFLTIAWAFTGLIALMLFPDVLEGMTVDSAEARSASETLFGKAIQHLLGDGWRGLMIACLLAGVTSAETLMVTGAGIFSRNLYRQQTVDSLGQQTLWVERYAAIGILAISIVLAFGAESVTQLLMASFKVIALLGAAFWLGVFWRRANAIGVWASFAATVLVLVAIEVPIQTTAGVPVLGPFVSFLQGLPRPIGILIMLVVEFGTMILASLLSRPQDTGTLNAFYARLHTPVGQEQDLACTEANPDMPDVFTLGMHGITLDYERASMYAYTELRRYGIELPRMTFMDVGGFVFAWFVVGVLIVLLVWLAGWGMS